MPLHSSAARAVAEIFDSYQTGMRDAARRAARHFAERDWVGARATASSRLTLYGARVNDAIARVDTVLGPRADLDGWAATRDAYAAEIEGREEIKKEILKRLKAPDPMRPQRK